MSMRLKIVASIAALILVLGVGWTIHTRITLSNISEDELDKRSLAIARDLEERAGELLLTNDSFSLYSHINDLTSNNEDVSYIVVFDASGNVRASTFTDGLPVGLREANSVPPGDTYALANVKTSRGDMIDTAYPINNGKLGTIRVGMSKERVQGEVNSLTYNMLGLTGGVLVAGLVVAYALATFLTRPLSRLTEAARAVGAGDLSRIVTVPGRDETAQVARAFNRMTEQLQEKEKERTELLGKVISAHEEERKRIARELHDEAGQALTSVLLGLKGLEDTCQLAEQRTKAGDLRKVTAETLDLMRDIALELRPSTLDDLGLVAALQRYVADFGRKYAVETDFHPGGLEGVRLNPQAETALYRIAQEALTNVVRHAEAHAVSVLLDRRDGRATLVVEDDGKGFDAEDVRRRGSTNRKLGLLGMEERASLVGGSITIESRAGGGTAVFVEVPADGGQDGADPNTHR
jgi:signal transduction histidine kinase